MLEGEEDDESAWEVVVMGEDGGAERGKVLDLVVEEEGGVLGLREIPDMVEKY